MTQWQRLFATIFVPLSAPQDWHVLTYKNIKPNQVVFAKEQLTVKVDRSASPLVYALKKSVLVTGVKVIGRRSVALSIARGKKQGDSGADDFALRVGLVVQGGRHLSGWQRWVAPEWVKYLYSLAPPNTGVDHIEFLNVVESPELIGQWRKHPKSDLLIERFVTLPEKNGNISFEWRPKNPLNVLALWLAIDGDDTEGIFNVEIKNITLETK